MHFNDIGVRIEVELPHTLEQHGLSDDAAGVAHQIFEHSEFLRLQLDWHAAAAYRPPQQIHFEIDDLLIDLLDRSRRSTNDGIQPGKQLGEGERLEEIVVGARLETFDTIVDAA